MRSRICWDAAQMEQPTAANGLGSAMSGFWQSPPSPHRYLADHE